VSSLSLEELTAQVRAAVGADSGLGKTLKLNLKSDGIVFIDGGTVSNEDRPADLTITISLDNLLAMGAGRLKPAYAIMVGKLRCSDMGLLMSLEEPLTALIARFV
jgi:putative sterol carrier protein